MATEQPPPRTGMIVLASEQTWPNLLGLLHFKNQVTALRIYHSGNLRASQGPAQRFQQWCHRQFPDLEVRLSGEDNSCGICPHEVTAKVRDWITEEPEWNWIINVTGGLKLMVFGLTDLLLPTGQTPDQTHNQNQRVRLIYRELTGQWFALQRDAKGAVRALPFEVSPTLADALDIETLAELQQGNQWMPQNAERLPVFDLVRAGFDTQWNWVSAFARCGLNAPKQGNLFEKFVAAVLLHMGVERVAINLQTGQDGAHQSEVDVACLRHNRLYVFDCKLTTTEQLPGDRQEKTSLVTEVCDTAQRLNSMGGVNARGFLLRPSRDYSEKLQELASSLRVQIWDRRAMRHFVGKLSEELNFPHEEWSEELQRAHAFLEEKLGPEDEAFCRRESFLTARIAPGDFPIFNQHALEQ